MRGWILGSLVMLAASAAAAQSGEALLEAKGCLACHGVDQKKMGPGLRDAAGFGLPEGAAGFFPVCK